MSNTSTIHPFSPPKTRLRLTLISGIALAMLALGYLFFRAMIGVEHYVLLVTR